MPIYPFNHRIPQINSSSYVHPQAIIIGDVIVGSECFVGPGAVLRGDFGKIIVGNGSVIQDNCIIHTDPECITIIESYVIIGHGAIVHGPSRLHAYSSVGMGSIVSVNCELESKSLLAAGSILPPRKTVEKRTIAAGNPARKIREMDEQMILNHKKAVESYNKLVEQYKQNEKK